MLPFAGVLNGPYVTGAPVFGVITKLYVVGSWWFFSNLITNLFARAYLFPEGMSPVCPAAAQVVLSCL